MMKKKADLHPAKDPIQINITLVILMCIIFALLFFILGVCTRHYPSISAVI